MGNMLKKSANFKINLQCFTANLRKRIVLYCAMVDARSKKIIICGPRRKQ